MPQLEPGDVVIVADNGSDVDLGPLERRWPALRLVHQPQKGAGPARNAGAATADTPWLAFLDADCVPADDWLPVARQIVRQDAVLGGHVRLFDETPAPRSGAEAFETVFAFRIPLYLQKGFLPSCQLIMAREAFERVGGFEAKVSEDVDWSRRSQAAGLKLGMDEALVISHPTRAEWPALAKKWRRLTEEGFQTDGQGTTARLLWAGKALLMPASALVHIPRILTHSEITLSEKRSATVTLLRLRILRMWWMLRQAIGVGI